MATRIESLDNPRVKAAVRLRDRRGRTRQERIIIDGLRELLSAAEAGVEFLELFRREELSEHEQQVWARISLSPAAQLEVSSRVFKKLCYGDRDEGIIAVARPPSSCLADWQVGPEDFILVLDNLEKPGNVGAIFRTADAVGADGVLLTGTGTDRYNPNALRASLGTVFTTRAETVTNVEAADWLRLHSFQVVAARTEGAQSHSQISYAGRTAVVLGSESHGVSEIWRSAEVSAVSLPMRGVADSLNVSVAAAVICYEALRQRMAVTQS